MRTATRRRGGLRHCPGFKEFWAASTVSGFGSYVTVLAVRVLVVVTLHGSAAQVGLVNAAGWLRYLLFGVLTGVLVDRVRRRPVLVATDRGPCPHRSEPRRRPDLRPGSCRGGGVAPRRSGAVLIDAVSYVISGVLIARITVTRPCGPSRWAVGADRGVVYPDPVGGAVVGGAGVGGAAEQ